MKRTMMLLAASLALTTGMARKPPEEKTTVTDPARILVSDRTDGPSFWNGGYSQSPGETAVVRDDEAWKALWKDKIGAEAPAVDFSQYFAVAVFLGSRNTGGYGVEFLPPKAESGKLVLEYKEKKPAAGGFVIQAFTQPYAVQLYRKTGLPVEVRAR